MLNRLFIVIECIFLLTACSVNKKQAAKGISGMPPCLVTKIQNIESNPKQTSPRSVSQFDYNGKTVFYVVQPCCDQFNEVYDSDCNYLGAPNGGITGKGDGKLNDFSTVAKNEKIIWQSGK